MDKRRGKKRKDEEPGKPTKEEYRVAKFMRFNVPTREGKLVGMTVQYFVAAKAVDALMESKWGKSNSDPLFTSRQACVDYCDRLLQKGMYHRAVRIEKRKDKKKKKLKEGEAEEVSKDEKAKKDKKNKKSKEGDKEKTEEGDEAIADSKEKEKAEAKKDEEKKEEDKKKKKKIKLEMHDQQIFKDGEEYYVWIYDPVPLKTFLIGLLLVLGAIAVCLFPLWPPEVRLGVYYLSLAAAGFVGVILSLCVIRMILFCVVWGITFGKHHFWFLPNLTEDVGFWDSFRPLYKHDIMNGEKDKDEETDMKDEKDEDKTEGSDGKSDRVEKKEDANEEENKTDQDEEDKGESVSGSEVDNENGYEIVDAEEVVEEDAEADGETKKTK